MSIADKVKQQQDKEGMLRRALERIIQLYTDKSHFVYELLQNAEDAGATEIKFIQKEDCLEVLHDGRPFSEENLRSLCDIGKSDKIGDLNQIGEFGVGFKSVFGICETVRLYSHPRKADEAKGFEPFSVEIHDFTNPVDIKDEAIGSIYTTRFVFPYKVGLTFSGFDSVLKLNKVLSERLQNLGITTLLFMKNLQIIEYEIDIPGLTTSGFYMLSKKIINDHCSLVSASGETSGNTLQKDEKKEETSYLVFSAPVTGIQEGRTIDIAFTVAIDDKGDYTFTEPKSPYISVYFPTETESKLKFIVQGPYRTTPNRSSVPADDNENLELAEQTAELLWNSIQELRDKGKLNLSLLNILPLNEEAFKYAPLFKCLYDKTVEILEDDGEEYLICNNGSYVSQNKAKISRGKELAEVFSDELLSELLNDYYHNYDDEDIEEYHWLPTVLTETNKQYKDLYTFLTDTLNIEVLRPENMGKYFSNLNSSFLQKRDNEWLVKFYNMYDKVEGAFSKQRGNSNMLTANIIKTSKNTFIAPYRRSDENQYTYSSFFQANENSTYLPNVFLPPKDMAPIDDIPFVNEEIYHKCEHFFCETLGLQEPDEYAFFVQDFKRRYSTNNSIPDKKHIADIKRLLQYKENDDYRKDVDNLIKKYLRLRCYRKDDNFYISPFKENVYFSKTDNNMSIEYYFKNLNLTKNNWSLEYSSTHLYNTAYIDLDFYQSYGIERNTLSRLGVSQNITTGEDKTYGEYHTGNPGKQPSWTTYGDFRWKLSLYNLDDVLNYIEDHPNEKDSMAKSSFIFNFLQQNEKKLMGDVKIGGLYEPNKYGVSSEIVTILRGDKKTRHWDGKWLFTKNNELVSQKDISRRELNTQLYGNINWDSQLYDILGFKKDSINDVKEDYDCLSDEKKKLYFEIEFQRRFNIPLNEVEKILEGKISGGYVPIQSADYTYEFPSSSVKNWDALRKHVAEVLCFASPAKYEYVVRRIRTSKPKADIQAYLKNMYKIDFRSNEYACQMCHNVFINMEMCQIRNKTELELDAMNLCLCPNCASEYKKMRTASDDVENFLNDISKLEDDEISEEDPVEIDFNGKQIWFTQTHVAEIKELLALQDEADEHTENT